MGGGAALLRVEGVSLGAAVLFGGLAEDRIEELIAGAEWETFDRAGFEVGAVFAEFLFVHGGDPFGCSDAEY